MADSVLTPFTKSQATRPLPGNGHKPTVRLGRRPVLDVKASPFGDLWHDTLDLLAASNHPPTLFTRGGGITRVRHGIVKDLDPHDLLCEVSERIDFVRTSKGGLTPCDPPSNVLAAVLAASDKPFPGLDHIRKSPFVSSDRCIVVTPGYDAPSRTYYLASPDLVIPPITANIVKAKEVFRDWLGDFPFANPASVANALSVPLTGMVRDCIDGPTPFYVIEAAASRTGKTLLGNTLCIPLLGEAPAAWTLPESDEEMEKIITTIVRSGSPVAFFDNIKVRVDSAPLEKFLAARTVVGRLLGTNRDVTGATPDLSLGTANGPRFSKDMANRSVSIGLDARCEHPGDRTGFQHPDIIGYTRKNRGVILSAFLGLVQNWRDQGQPLFTARVLGGYQAWSGVVGGILGAAGIVDFIANQRDFQDQAAGDDAWKRTFVLAWADRFGTHPVTASQLLEIARVVEGFPLGRSTSERGEATSLGIALRSLRGVVAAYWRVMPPMSNGKTTQYQLEPRQSDALAQTPERTHCDQPPPTDLRVSPPTGDGLALPPTEMEVLGPIDRSSPVPASLPSEAGREVFEL
jgi:hypothetical protein